ncbi:MAG: nitrite reductase small subunit NirD [Pseudomonadota bacterium]
MNVHVSSVQWIAIGNLSDIPVRGARCVVTPLGKIGIFRTASDTVFAIEDHCPHKGGPLTQGIVHGRSVTCPLHNWVIDLETGQAQGADEGSVETLPIRVTDGDVIELGLEPATLAAVADG